MAVPTSIRKRDGRLEDFEPDKLARSIFAATEALGGPDAFLARELADGVVHFLTNEDSPTVTTEDLNELATKVIRELGHPALARTYRERAERKPANRDLAAPLSVEVRIDGTHAGAAEMANFSLNHVYQRDLVSAHGEGLLELLDLQMPFTMFGVVLQGCQGGNPSQLFELLYQSRDFAHSFVAIDGLDYLLASGDAEPETAVRQIAQAVESVQLNDGPRVILNLNMQEPPAAVGSANVGPLFSGLEGNVDQQRTGRVAELCLESVNNARIFWHLSDVDFRDEAAERLQTVVRAAIASANVDFVFDRRNRPVVLGPGVRRDRPGVLGMVAMNLPRFVEHLGGGPIDPDVYFRKLASLARFARSAGRARRDFLRRRGAPYFREGFLLDRAIQIVVPRDVVEAARRAAGEAQQSDVSDLVRKSLETIRTALETDQNRPTDCAIDFPLEAGIDLQANDLGPSVRRQLKTFSVWQQTSGGGCSTISLKPIAPDFIKEVPDLLHAAWRLGAYRLRFARHD